MGVVLGIVIAVCGMLPLVLFHLSAPAMVLAVIGGVAVGCVIVHIFCLALLFTLFKDG